MKNTLDKLSQKKQSLEAKGYSLDKWTQNLNDWFKIELTYTSNAIEGNTLSRAETALVIEKGLTVEGKSLVEHLEAVNHAQAYDWIVGQIKTAKQDINQDTILDLHRLILSKIDDINAGRYRNVPVRIAGSTVIMPNALKIPDLMRKFISWLHIDNSHPVKIAIDAHFKLVSIHPFVDGNGRTARLLMNLVLMQNGYPPAIIRKEDRKLYIASIEKAQLGGSLADYYALMYEAVDRSLDIYAETFENDHKTKMLESKDLLQIGELAKLTKETVPTIRYWTKEGLLNVARYSDGGYQLYSQECVEIVSKIRRLQIDKRLTIGEIKRELSK